MAPIVRGIYLFMQNRRARRFARPDISWGSATIYGAVIFGFALLDV